jgi:hypothetical protein
MTTQTYTPRGRILTLRACIVLAACLALLGLNGCGSSYVATGTIEIHNSAFSFEAIDSVTITQQFGPDEFFYNVFLAPGESFFASGLRVGTYTVRLFWTDAAVDTFFDVDVFEGTTTTVVGEN